MKTLFTAILATICICMARPYLFMPANMLLLETAIIGIPSFFLSLQPNKDRVQGKFISHVMSGAVSGAAYDYLRYGDVSDYGNKSDDI